MAWKVALAVRRRGDTKAVVQRYIKRPSCPTPTLKILLKRRKEEEKRRKEEAKPLPFPYPLRLPFCCFGWPSVDCRENNSNIAFISSRDSSAPAHPSAKRRSPKRPQPRQQPTRSAFSGDRPPAQPRQERLRPQQSRTSSPSPQASQHFAGHHQARRPRPQYSTY